MEDIRQDILQNIIKDSNKDLIFVIKTQEGYCQRQIPNDERLENVVNQI